MADEILQRDPNHITVLGGITDDSAQDVAMLRVDPVTKRLLVSAIGIPGAGTVTSVSVVTANGFAGSVANATSTPAITLRTTVTGILKGNGTAISAAVAGTDYLENITGLVQQGTNIVISGSGTSGDPYIITATGGGSGTVTSVGTGTGLTGGTITTTGTISLNTKLAPMDTLAANSLKLLRVNVGETAVEYVAISTYGFVVGPASATDNAVARYDGTTGKLIQNSGVTISDLDGNNNYIITGFPNPATALGIILQGITTGTNINAGGAAVYGADALGSGNGGFANLTGGVGGSTGTGGTCTISGGAGGSISGNGGNVFIQGGLPDGGGDQGSVIIQKQNATAYNPADLLVGIEGAPSIFNSEPGGSAAITLNALSATSAQNCYAIIAAVSENANAVNTALTFGTRVPDSGGVVPERMRITSVGKVGIGTSTPTTKLHLFQSDDGTVLRIQSAFSLGQASVDLETLDSYYRLIANPASNDSTFVIYDQLNLVERLLISPTGEVGIGTATPNANAILDVFSTTKAFMPPRMTTTQRDAIPSPTAGMVIYNSTTNVLNFYNGATWGAV